MKSKITEAEAEALDFKKLKEFAKQHGVTNNSKDGLIRELKKAGHIGEEDVNPKPSSAKSKTFWRITVTRPVLIEGTSVKPGDVYETESEETAAAMYCSQKLATWERRKRYASGKTELVERYPEDAK